MNRICLKKTSFSPLALIKALLPHMKSRGTGRIINIVSSAGRVPIPTVGVYGGSKSALAVMSNTMRLELAPAGIDIINIYPGTINSSFEENALREEKRPGLCPTDSCGLPKLDIAEQVLEASLGSPGEVWLERQGRWLATAALVWPGYVDKKLAPVRDKVVQSKSLKKRRWRLLQVESSIACNLKCIMCPWKQSRKTAKNQGNMTQETWEAIRPFLSNVKSIDFTGGGETLLQPRLAEWASEAKSAGCETGILTNGMLLNREKIRQLYRAGIDWICVSIDGATKDVYEGIRQGADFDLVCRNLTDLVSMRAEKHPRIMINFVLMSVNFHQVEDIIRLASDIGVDQVNFKQCDVIRGGDGKGFGLFVVKETKDIHRLEKDLSKARVLAKKLKIHTTAFSFTPEEKAVCEQDPRDSLFILHNGAVAPCINLAIGGPATFLGEDINVPSVHYGTLMENSLDELWETELCNFYRKRFGERVDAYEDTLVKALTEHSTGRERTMKAAQEAMKEPPEGCRTCHYLYGI